MGSQISSYFQTEEDSWCKKTIHQKYLVHKQIINHKIKLKPLKVTTCKKKK